MPATESGMLERAFANAQETDGIEDWGRRFVSYEAARHANSTPTIQEAAIKDPWPAVRCAALENPSVPPNILAIAIEDPEASVRMHAASHPNATPEILAKAMDDADDAVRGAAARNRIAPAEVLVAALLDEDRRVAQDAAENWKARGLSQPDESQIPHARRAEKSCRKNSENMFKNMLIYIR